MVFLGFLLVVASIAVVVGVVVESTEPANLIVFGQTVPGVNEQWQVFLAGAIMTVVFIAGVALTIAGAAHRARTRRDLRELREEHEESLSTLEMEKRRLQRELARVRQGAGAGPAVSSASGPHTPPGGVRRVPSPRRGAAPAAESTRGAPRSQIAATSPFFDRND